MTDISELIAACRARLAAVTDHPASDPLFDYAVWAVETMPRLLDALEAAQRPPLGYVVVEPECDRVAYRGEIWEDRETGEFYAAEDSSMRLVELREVQS